MAASGAAGGVGSIMGGGKFGNGAMTGAFSRLFNEEVALRAQLSPNGKANYDVAVKRGYKVVDFDPNADDVKLHGVTRTGYTYTRMVAKEIVYARNKGFLLDSGEGVISPITFFEHELGHIVRTETNPGSQTVDYLSHQPGPSGFRNMEEFQNVRDNEWPAADFHGDPRRNCYPCGKWVDYP